MAIIKTKFNRGIEGATNIVDTGTEGTRVATGTTAQRGSTAGQFRFNSTTGKFEGFDGTTFHEMLAPPIVTSVDDTNVDSESGGNQTFIITGNNFKAGDVASFVGSDGTEITSSTTTVNSETQITAIIPKASFINSKEPYDIKITSSAGFVGTLDNQINVDNTPSWNTSSGSLGSSNWLTNVNLTPTATDPDGETITYSETTSVLSGAGLSLNTSTGVITGDPVDTATTYNFTLRATSSSGTADRAFSYTVTAPTISTQYLLVAGGGAGGTSTPGYYEAGGGGGAGGLLAGTLSVLLGTTYSFVIGQGGTGSTDPVNNTVTSGTDTTGLGLTAVGGGKGNNRYNAGSTGGSGGGSGVGNGYAGTSGQGNSGGGNYFAHESSTGGGGGGAGSAGSNGSSSSGGSGGNGISNSITGSSITYAGGGGGSGSANGNGSGGTGGSGGGGNGNYNGTAGYGTDGLGGGGGATHSNNRSGDGGNGVVIIRIPTSDYTGTYTGSPTITTVGSDTVLKYLANGSYTF